MPTLKHFSIALQRDLKKGMVNVQQIQQMSPEIKQCNLF